MQRTLNYRHRAITDDDVVFIRELIAEHPGLSRRGLSKKLCEAWNWVQANGALRDMVCRGLMLMLHREGLIELPPVRCVPHNPLADRSQPVLVSVDEAPVRGDSPNSGRWKYAKSGGRRKRPCSTVCSSSTTTWATRSR